MKRDGRPDEFLDSFDDGYDTHQIPTETMSDLVYGSEPETELDMEDVMIVEDDCVPQYIDPSSEPTKPMPWTSRPDPRRNFDDEPTVVEIHVVKGAA